MMTPTLRPKLLYLTAAYRPGSMAIPVHTELLAALAERGYPSAIVTLAPPGQREPVLAVPDGDLPVYRVAISRTLLDRVANRYARTRFIYPYLITTARYLRPWLRAQLAADPAIIVQGEMAFPMGALLRRALVGTPARSVVTLHGGDVLQADDGSSYGYAWSPAVQRELRAVFGWVGGVRAMSPLLARAAERFGCDPAKIATVPLNTSAHFYPNEPLSPLRERSRRAALAELGLPEDARILLASGRVLPIKGFDTLVDALPAILAAHPATYLLLYGPDRGGTSDALRAQVAALGLAAQVRFLGTLPFDGQGRFLAAADLSVIPSTLDGFNRTGIEAGAHGTPIVASTGAGIADFVRDYGAGRAVPPRDPAALATAISALLADRAEWAAASAGAVRLADACRSERVAEGLTALYARIAASPGARS
jgi:glycosyltransferase involved in cell wall biosynthesis